MKTKEKKLYFYESSDIHGHIYEENTSYGLSRISSLLKEKRKVHKNVIAIDNGDYLQGTPLASFMALRHPQKTPEPLIEALNISKYDYFNIGNHEFNFGQVYLKKAITLFKGKVLCANCVTKDGEVVFGKAYDILECDGIRVGILGVVTDAIIKWERPEHLENLVFLDPVETCQKYAKELKNKVDFLLVVYHGGPEKDFITGEKIGLGNEEHDALRLIDEIDEIDAIFCGHQHRLFSELYKKRPLLSPSWRGSYVAELECIFEEIEGKIYLKETKTNLISTKDYPVDEEIKTYLLPWLEEVDKWLDKPLGYVTKAMQIKDIVKACSYNHPYLDFVNEIQLKSTGADISATSFFGLKVKGLMSKVKVRDVIKNYTYSNSLKVLAVTGYDLRLALEKCASFFTILDNQLALKVAKEGEFIALYNYDVYKGINYTFDVSRPLGKRVVDLTYKGKRISDNDTFTLALNNYRAVGGGDYTMFSEEKIIQTIEQDVVDLMIAYIESNPFVNSYRENSFKVIGYKK